MKFYPTNMLTAQKGNLKPISLPYTKGPRLVPSPESIEKYMRKFVITTEKFNTTTPTKCGQKLKIKG